MLTVKQLKQRKVSEVTLSESRFYKKWQTSAVIREISDSSLRRSYLHLKFVFPQVMSSPFHIMLMFNNLLSINYQLPIDKKLIGTQSKVLSTTYGNFVLIPLTIKEDTTHLTLSPLNPKIFRKIIWALKGDWNSFDMRLHQDLCSCQKVGAVGDSSTRHFNQRTKAAFRTE